MRIFAIDVGRREVLDGYCTPNFILGVELLFHLSQHKMGSILPYVPSCAGSNAVVVCCSFLCD
jgi:hypothetical protein